MLSSFDIDPKSGSCQALLLACFQTLRRLQNISPLPLTMILRRRDSEVVCNLLAFFVVRRELLCL